MIHQMDGKLLQTFKHPFTVYGCDWNPNNENIIATACEDSNIRVFYVGSGTDQPLKILSGHEGKVFRVKWSLLNDGILSSTSDDCSVRIWHYAQGIAVRILEGHSSYTRGLLWCPELPNIVISGSWDSTIRVWDINDGACLDIIEDHGADVYGLACHAERPFMLASTSRDSTVRLWSIFPLVSSIYLKIIVSRPLSEIFSPSVIQSTEGFDISLGLYGIQSKKFKEILSKDLNQACSEKWKALSMLFCSSSGTGNLFDLLDVLKNKDVDFSQYKNGIVHRKHVIQLTTAKALEKELVNVKAFGSGVNSSGKEENVLKAAEYHLLTGNLRKYCELKIQLGEWLEALALAPGVSLNYWRELGTRWLNLFKEENIELLAPLCIATNNSDELIRYYVKQNFMEKAHIVSVAVSEGLLPFASISNEDKVQEKSTSDTVYNELIKENLKNLSERYLLCGYPARAACWQLSNGEIQEAIFYLLRGHELELALNICLSLGVDGSVFKMAVVYLSWRCARNGDWELALEVLDLIPENENEKMKICIMCCLSESERNDLHKMANLPSVQECAIVAHDKLQSGSVLKAVQYYLLSSNPKKGLDVGLKYVKDVFSEPRWRLETVWQILYCMSFIKSDLLQDISCDRHRFELQVYSAYTGALIAIRQRFYPVVVPLFSTALSHMRSVHNASLSITEDMVLSEMHAWVNAKDNCKSHSEDIIYKELVAKALRDDPFGDIGVTIVNGSNLPRHSDHHRCYLRGSTIKGPVYFLDDFKSSISLNDALMWAKVNRFSPLKTGFVIQPF